MKITFSLVGGRKLSLDGSLDDQISSFIHRVKSEFGFSENDKIQFVYFGEILVPEATLRQINYFQDSIIFVESPLIPSSQLPQNQESEQNSQENEQNQSDQERDDQSDDSDQNISNDEIADHFREITLQLFNLLLNNQNATRPPLNASNTTANILRRKKIPYSYPCNISLSKSQKEERSKQIAEKAQINEAFLSSKSVILDAIIEHVENKEKIANSPESITPLLLQHLDSSPEFLSDESKTIIDDLITRYNISSSMAVRLYQICRGDSEACKIFMETMQTRLRTNRSRDVFDFFLQNHTRDNDSESSSSDYENTDDEHFSLYQTGGDDFVID